MGLKLLNPFNGSLKGYWRRKRSYQRVDGRRTMRVMKFGATTKRSWRFRIVPKLRLKMVSPVKLWSKLKNGYMNKMLSLGGNAGQLSNGNLFGGKRIPKDRQVVAKYSNTEFENRLIYEIYKSLVVSMELYNR